MERSNYFRALFMTNMSFVVLLTIIVSAVIYFNGFNLQEKKLQAAHVEMLEQQGNKIDTSIDIAITSIGIFEDEELFKSYRDNPVSTPYANTGIFGRLTKIVSPFSKFGFTIGLCRNDSDWIISTRFATNFTDYFEYAGFSEESIVKAKKYLSDIDFFEQPYYTFQSLSQATDGNDLALTMIYRKKYPGKSIMNFFVSLYKDVVLPKINSPHEGFALIDNQMAIASNTQFYGQVAVDALAESSGTGNQIIKYDNFICYTRRSEVVPNWTYVYVAKKTNFIAFQLLFLTMLTAALFLLAGSWVAFTNAKRVYSPIRKIADILDRRDDLENGVESIENAIISINDLNAELSRRIENCEEDLKTKAFSELLYGLLSSEEAENIVETYNLKKYLKPLNVVVIKISDLFNTHSHDEIVKINRAVMDGIKDTLRESYEYFMIYKVDYKSYAVVIPENNQVDITESLTAVKTRIEESLGTVLLICIGKKVDSLYFAMESFADAMFVMSNRFFGNNTAVVFAEQASMDGGHQFYYPIDMERNFLLYIEKKQFDKAALLLERLLKNNLREHEMSREVTNEFIYSIIATIKRTLSQLNLTYEDVFEKNSILYIEMKFCETQEMLHDKIMECFMAIFEKAGGNQLEQGSSIERILAFIRENYQKDISLNDISDHFGLSSGYISRLFKNDAKTTFKDYLTLYRIQRAKDLLTSGGNMKISEIAQAVGYNSVGTFIRVFKRLEGIAPGEYLKIKN